MSISPIGPQVSTRVNDPASVDAAILSRFSARAYLPKAVALAGSFTRVLTCGPMGEMLMSKSPENF